MSRSLTLIAGLLSVLACRADDATKPDLDAVLRFEAGATGAGAPAGWHAAPPGTIKFEEQTVHGGLGAVLLARHPGSARDFSRILFRVPVDFEGGSVELRGFLRARDVSDRVALWLRTDGAAGTLAFDNMAESPVRGTTDWVEHAVSVPLDPDAKALVFGVLLAGTGEAWADDLQLLVDGEPLAQAPRRPVSKTVLDIDREFDDTSGIEVASLSERQVKHLAVLGRVWGFLKYHHPRVARGDWHWDYELFRVLPEVLQADGADERNRILAHWIERIGVPDHCDPCATPPEDAHLLPRLDWIRDAKLLGPDLSRQLQQIHRYRFAGDRHFYISQQSGVGNPAFRNEPAYADMPVPDAGFRILALFRLWNIVEYWFPYRNLVDDWQAVLPEYLSRLVHADERDSYRLEMLALIVRIGDGHANLWSDLRVRPPRGECFWPVDLHFVKDRLVVRSTAGSASPGFLAGDVVQGLDGRTVDDLVSEWLPFYAGSNEGARLWHIAHFFSRGECGDVRVSVSRDGRPLHLRVARTEVARPWEFTHDRPGEAFQMLSPDVAYLKLSSIRVRDLDAWLEAAMGTRGLVIDIRNYPSEFVPFALGSRLVEERTRFARFIVPDLANPGAFTWIRPVALEPDPEAVDYEGQVAILVDETSMSQAEYTAMALRTGPRSVVIGSKTAGADGNMSPIPLPGGLRTAISGIGVFYPDKTPTQGIGIVPDIVARPTLDGIREGRDEVLEAALRYIHGEEVDEAAIREMAKRPYEAVF